MPVAVELRERLPQKPRIIAVRFPLYDTLALDRRPKTRNPFRKQSLEPAGKTVDSIQPARGLLIVANLD
jgi:hypothetical protein